MKTLLLILGLASSFVGLAKAGFCSDCFIFRDGTNLYEPVTTVHKDNSVSLENHVFTFGGVNIYWLGQDHSDPDVPFGNNGRLHHPSHYRIDDVLTSARFMGSRVVRSHTLGISTGVGDFHGYFSGWEGTLWPRPYETHEENMDSMDYAIWKAGELGIRLIVPLTDNWNYYHGGVQDFLGWRNQSDLAGVPNQDVNVMLNQHRQDAFYDDPDIVNDFKAYISVLLNHQNQYTGVRYADDPTIMAWETGNELFYSPPSWIADIGRHIKDTIKAKQLFMDGKWVGIVGFDYSLFDDPVLQQEYTSVVDIVTDHFYPMSRAVMRHDADMVAKLGLVYVVGEIGWTQNMFVTPENFLTDAEWLKANGLLSGDILWSLFGHGMQYGYVTHGDGHTLFWPDGPFTEEHHHQLVRWFSNHFYNMADSPDNFEDMRHALDGNMKPVINVAECNSEEGLLTIAWRGVAGATYYNIIANGTVIAQLPDVNRDPWEIEADSTFWQHPLIVVPQTSHQEGLASDPVLCQLS